MKKTKRVLALLTLCLVAYSSHLLADPNRKNLCRTLVVNMLDDEVHNIFCRTEDGTCFDDFVIIADPLPDNENDN